MMSIEEYATDIEKTVEEILKKCKELGIEKTKEDLLEQDDIVMLDGAFDLVETDTIDDEEILDEIVEDLMEKENITVEETSSVQKLKKKRDLVKQKQEKLSLENKKKAMYKSKEKLISNIPIEIDKDIILYKENMTVKDISKELNVSGAEVVKKLIDLGEMVSANDIISFDNAEIIVSEYNKKIKQDSSEEEFEMFDIKDHKKDLKPRPPVVTIMGHVDHGKTTLLDTIRKANVVEGEAGGITQHIGTYQVEIEGKKITFIDTPGHAAFTEMRARGASVTDIVIIIIAADDGVMPQTKEAIEHAKASGAPIIVAINKIDTPGSNPERIKTELVDYGLTPDTWGGDTLYSEISALNGDGIKELLESVLLIAEMEDYKANPNRYACGTVIESRLDKQKGTIVSLLIQNGTLRLGDPIVVGDYYGKVRTLLNSNDEEILSALPSTPVEITGINGVPTAGDKFMAFESEKKARSIAEKRAITTVMKARKRNCAVSFDDLFDQIKTGVKKINVVLKTDVNGSKEAVKNSLEKIEVEGAKINVVCAAVGAISEGDIVLADASNAIVIGFNVRPDNKVKQYAENNSVEIRLYSVIYKIIEEMEAAMKGMLDPIYEEKVLGQAEVRKIFKFSKIGNICGSFVTTGIIKKDSNVRVIRDGIVIYEGKMNTLQKGKDNAKEVKKGFECGITIENYNDVKEKDIIESFEMVELK